MPAQTSFATAAGIMFLSGLGIPIFAALNGGLGRQLGNPVAAMVITFAVALVVTLVPLAFVGWNTPGARLGTIPPQYLAGALFIVFYGLAVTYLSPRIGVGNAVFFVLLGQLVAAAVIDHFGLFGAIHFALTPRRALGIAVMALGVWLAKRTT
jgi:transporter family-2 protein